MKQKWYGVYVSEMTVAVALVRFCKNNGIVSDRNGQMIWYKAYESENREVCKFLDQTR